MNGNCLSDVGKPSTLPARTAVAVLALAIVFALATLATPAAQAQTYTVIHTFTGGGDGSNPYTGLTIDASGNLYGTTSEGGSAIWYGGTVFELTHQDSSWRLTPLHAFYGGNDGTNPFGRVSLAPDGTLYGTTSCVLVDGCANVGTVFHLTPPPSGPKTALPPWDETVLYRFAGSDGANPQGDLTFDQSGNIYGTTLFGGSAGEGVVYELTPSGGGWTETVLYSSQDNPQGGVVLDKSGNLYGVFSDLVWYSNTDQAALAYGGVYQLSPSESGWTEQILYAFTDGDDGGYPMGGLITDQFGNLYGTTPTGGSDGCGTAFELTPASGGWIFRTIYSFPGACSEGGPEDKLAMDAAGNLYGTTTADGAWYGTVFKLTPLNGGWTYTSLHNFTGGSDGAFPFSSLVFDANGNLYGTAAYGGDNGCGSNPPGCGVVFEITP